MLPVDREGKGMGSILAFRPRKAAGKTPKQNASPATIIIFPGVRYERVPAADGNNKWSPVTWLGQFNSRPVPTT